MICLQEIVRTIAPLMIRGIVDFFLNRDTIPLWHGYAYASAISASVFILALSHHMYFYEGQRLGWHMRASSCALMYKKVRINLK